MAERFIKTALGARADQRPKVERLRVLTTKANALRGKGMFVEARAIEPEIRALKKDLGIKPIEKDLTPEQREQKKSQLKARLNKCR